MPSAGWAELQILRLGVGELFDGAAPFVQADETCAWKGPHGHLVWGHRKLRTGPISDVMYFGIGTAIGLTARPILWTTVPILGALAIYVATGIYLEWSPELDSTWCGLALFFHVYWLLLPFVPMAVASSTGSVSGKKDTKTA